MEALKDKKTEGTNREPPKVAINPYPNLFKKHFFDTENIWYHYTEIRKE
jgi:hypothetical protein